MGNYIKHSSLVVGCALLLALPFTWGWTWPACVPGLVFAMFLLMKSSKLSRRHFLLQCLLFGCVFFGVVVQWIYGIRTKELVGDSPFALFFIILTFFIVVGSLASGFVLFGILYRVMNVSVNNLTILYIPAIWAASEFFRSIFSSVAFYGSDGSIGPYWNFGTIGFVAMETPLRYTSRVVGLYGTSFLVVLIAALCFQVLRKKYRYAWLMLIPIVLSLIGWSSYSNSTGPTNSIAIAGLGGNVQDGYQDDLDAYLKNSSSIDSLVLPEYSHYFASEGGSQTYRKPPDNVQLIVDSASVKRRPDNAENMLQFHDNNGHLLQQQSKNFLIPGGEYIPYIGEGILFYSGNQDLIRSFDLDRSLRKSPEKERPFMHGESNYGALVCSGAMAPFLYTELVEQGATILTNSASLSTLGISNVYYRQAEQMSRFIATANSRPYVQSARGGPSYILDRNGALQVELMPPENGATFAHVDVRTNTKKTFYTKWGEWVLAVSVVAIFARIAYFVVANIRRQIRARKGIEST